MEVERLTLTPPSIEEEGESVQEAVTLRGVSVRAVDVSSQLLVLEISDEGATTTDTGSDRVGIVPGSSIVVRTAEGRVHRGYVEVVAEAACGRICWCGLDFDH